MPNLRKRIEEIMEELFDEAENYIEGKFYTRKEHIDQATDQILQVFEETLPKREEIKNEDIRRGHKFYYKKGRAKW